MVLVHQNVAQNISTLGLGSNTVLVNETGTYRTADGKEVMHFIAGSRVDRADALKFGILTNEEGEREAVHTLEVDLADAVQINNLLDTLGEAARDVDAARTRAEEAAKALQTLADTAAGKAASQAVSEEVASRDQAKADAANPDGQTSSERGESNPAVDGQPNPRAMDGPGEPVFGDADPKVKEPAPVASDDEQAAAEKATLEKEQGSKAQPGIDSNKKEPAADSNKTNKTEKK